MKISTLNDEEYAFLREYHSVITLIATALKSIESDRYTFALYLPTLFGLKIKLQELIDENLIFDCIPLVQAVQNGIESRFGNLMDPFSSDKKSVPLFIAMMTNPNFKLNFMGMKEISSNLLNKLKDMLVSEAAKIENENPNQSSNDDNADVHTHGSNLSF